MNARYFTRYCGRGPYDEIWLRPQRRRELRRHAAPHARCACGSLVVLGTATGQVLAHFERELGVRAHGCEISALGARAHSRAPPRGASSARDLRRYLPRLVRAGGAST